MTIAETPDEIEAAGHDLIAEGHAFLARARRLRVTPPVDELLDTESVELEFRIRFRVVTDAARRGDLTLEHAGRKPLVRRSALEAWVSRRPKAAAVTAPNVSPRQAARDAVAARARTA